VKTLLSLKTLRHPWGIFTFGLLSWPTYWGAEAFYKSGLVESRNTLDWIGVVLAIIGFLCCLGAPFFSCMTFKRKLFFSGLAVLAFIGDCYASIFLFIAIFGAPKI